jgi:two-component system sensor histidine kinase KdpD
LEPVEISNPINKSILLLRHQIAEKHLNIAFQTEQSLYVTGDEKRLGRLFINLLENVVRYSPFYANVTITPSPVEDQNSRYIKISIEDEGPGIPEQDLARIFDQFYQVEKNSSIESGSGLGLCYCKMIVEAHGGTIWAENRRQGGTAFKLLLPVYPDMPKERMVKNGN